MAGGRSSKNTESQHAHAVQRRPRDSLTLYSSPKKIEHFREVPTALTWAHSRLQTRGAVEEVDALALFLAEGVHARHRLLHALAAREQAGFPPLSLAFTLNQCTTARPRA